MADLPVSTEAPEELGPRAFRAVLCIEGEPTEDGRVLMPGSIEWRDTPLPLMGLYETPEWGHTGAIVAGRIDTITREGSNIVAYGVWDETDVGGQFADWAQDGTVIGVSVDLAILVMEYEEPRFFDEEGIPATEDDLAPQAGAEETSGSYPDPDDPTKNLVRVVTGEYLMRVVKGKIMGATQCPMQAIETARIMPDGEGGSVVPVDALAASGWLKGYGAITAATKTPGDAEPPDPEDDPPVMIAALPNAAHAASIAAASPQASSSHEPVPPSEHHVTLASLGPKSSLSPEQLAAARETTAERASTTNAMPGKVGGAGVMAAGDGKGDAVVHPDSGPALNDLHRGVQDDLAASGVPAATEHGFLPHMTVGKTDTPAQDTPHAAVGMPLDLDQLAFCVGDHWETFDLQRPDAHENVDDAVTASAAGCAPDFPPLGWFADPELAEPTAVTIDAEGKISGHIALWHTCHTGIPGVCTTPPRSRSGYAHLHTGSILTAEGVEIPCGVLTMDTDHASLDLAARPARQHYDNTGHQAADVVAGEDRFGIWIAGAIRPDLTTAALRTLRASGPSGDWREIGGALEMIGVLAVNVQGYPVPRARAVTASTGLRVTSLVSAGIGELRDEQAEILELAEQAMPGTQQRIIESLAASAR